MLVSQLTWLVRKPANQVKTTVASFTLYRRGQRFKTHFTFYKTHIKLPQRLQIFNFIQIISIYFQTPLISTIKNNTMIEKL